MFFRRISCFLAMCLSFSTAVSLGCKSLGGRQMDPRCERPCVFHSADPGSHQTSQTAPSDRLCGVIFRTYDGLFFLEQEFLKHFEREFGTAGGVGSWLVLLGPTAERQLESIRRRCSGPLLIEARGRVCNSNAPMSSSVVSPVRVRLQEVFWACEYSVGTEE